MRYHYLPNTSELLRILKVRRKSAPLDRWSRTCLYISVAWFLIGAVCMGGDYLNWFEKETSNYIVLVSLVAVLFLLLFIMLAAVSSIGGMFKDPAKEMAIQMDVEANMELQLKNAVVSISPAALWERHQSLESELAKRDNWLDVVRLFAIIVPAGLLISVALVGKTHISSLVQLALYSFLTGLAIGGVLIRAGSTELQRLSFVLKKIGERRLADQARRRGRRRR